MDNKQSARILVVEDEIIVARSIQNRLQGLGYEVLALASSGEKAIQQVDQARPDLVLMDIRLKGKIDGIEAAAQIRARFQTPVVYLTAYGDEDTLQRAKITEPFGYVLKPFDLTELRAAIEVALYKHQMEQKRKQLEAEREQLISELQEALVKIKTLSGLIPICASCKKVRDDQGYWQQVEVYIKNHSDATFSHGLCPECAHKLYPDFFEE